MPFVNVDAYLGNKRISRGKLSKRIGSNSKLADADNADSKLGDGDDTACKLPDRDYSFSNNRESILAVLKRYVDKRQAEEGSF
jgi:hypothetical protein